MKYLELENQRANNVDNNHVIFNIVTGAGTMEEKNIQ